LGAESDSSRFALRHIRGERSGEKEGEAGLVSPACCLTDIAVNFAEGRGRRQEEEGRNKTKKKTHQPVKWACLQHEKEEKRKHFVNIDNYSGV